MLRRIRPLLLLGCAGIALTLACSKKSPGEPSAPGGLPGNTATQTTFVGDLSVASDSNLGGILVLKKSSGTIHASRGGPNQWLRAIAELLQPTLHAQTSATGTLATNGGPAVSLAGTFSGNTFNMTGGGYTITANVSGSSISGTGTAPGGAPAQVAAVLSPTPPGTPPSAVQGTYVSTFHIDTVWSIKVTRTDNGVVQANCSQPVAIDGNLSLGLSQDAVNLYVGHLQTSWTERGNGAQTGFGCFPFVTFTASGYGLDYAGPLDPLVFAVTDTGVSNGYNITRTQAFVGTVVGNTIQGRYWISFALTGQTTTFPPQNIYNGYPNTNVVVTLTKQ